MAGSLRNRGRRDGRRESSASEDSSFEQSSGSSEPSSDLEVYSKEVLKALIDDNLPPTPNNFSLYFDRLLEDKSENLRKQIMSMLELEESNDAENTIMLEQSLKQGFTSVKSILSITAGLYKNIVLMSKILEKRKTELDGSDSSKSSKTVVAALEADVSKLNDILKKQNVNLKGQYDQTFKVIKSVENETIFDNQYGVYNKRYLLTKVEKEIELVKEFKHSSSLIMVELSKELMKEINSEKAAILMTRTIARLLLKTSRRSDTVAYYGNGQFSMLLKHTNIDNAKKTSERLVDLVSNSNFFLADREIQLKIAIGITEINPAYSVEEIIVETMNGIEKAYEDKDIDFVVSVKE